MKVKKTTTTHVLEAKEFIRDRRSPTPSNVMTSRVMSHNKAKNTGPEIILRSALWTNGFRGYRLHWKKTPGSPDIVYTIKKVAIFVNGCFWHRCPYCKPHSPQTNTSFWNNKFVANAERDKRKTDQLIQLGWRVITIWECQVKKDLDEQLDKISKIYYE
jgi:DNA mismatch endonuclease (patch repair protein)